MTIEISKRKRILRFIIMKFVNFFKYIKIFKNRGSETSITSMSTPMPNNFFNIGKVLMFFWKFIFDYLHFLSSRYRLKFKFIFFEKTILSITRKFKLTKYI